MFCGGRIDISTIPLVDLRSRLTIVAQEAYMFTGSLRFKSVSFSSSSPSPSCQISSILSSRSFSIDQLTE